jgi:hypothetical protein
VIALCGQEKRQIRIEGLAKNEVDDLGLGVNPRTRLLIALRAVLEVAHIALVRSGQLTGAPDAYHDLWVVAGIFAPRSSVAVRSCARLKRPASSDVTSNNRGHHLGLVEELRVANDDARLAARHRRRNACIVEHTRPELLLVTVACDRHSDVAHLAAYNAHRALHAQRPLLEAAASRLDLILILKAVCRALLERRGKWRESPEVRGRLGSP